MRLTILLLATCASVAVWASPAPEKRKLESKAAASADQPSKQVRFESASPTAEHQHRRKRDKTKALFKKAFKQAKVKVKRVTDTVDHGLQKASNAEKRLHNAIKRTFVVEPLRALGSAAVQSYMVMAVVLEPYLGERLMYHVDNGMSIVSAGVVVVGRKVGRFIIDHMAAVIGIGVGLLVSLAITLGLGYVSMNPVVGGAIGGAVGAVAGITTEHILNAVIHGHVVPSSLREVAVRGVHFTAAATLAAGTGAAVGAATAGVGSVVGHALGTVGGELAAEITAHTIGHVGGELATKPAKDAIEKHKEERLEHIQREHGRK